MAVLLSGVAEKMTMLFNDSVIAIASLGSVYINISTGPLNLSRVRAISETSLAMIARQPGNICNLSVIAVGDVLQEPEIRTAMTQLMSDVNKRTAASALVFTGGGLLGTVLRAAVSTVMIAARAQFPIKTFKEPDTAMGWLADFMSPRPSALDRANYVQQVGELFEQRQARKKNAG